MGNLFHHPVALLVLVVIIILVFGANKLPGAARSLGRSMRIFQSEIKGMQDENKGNSEPVVRGTVTSAEDAAKTAKEPMSGVYPPHPEQRPNPPAGQ